MSKSKQTDVQQTLDLGQIVSNIETRLEKGFTGVITKVEQTNSNTFFKDTTGKYDDRTGFAVTVTVDNDGTEFSQFFSVPNLRGYEQSNLYAFKHKYGNIPIVNQKVSIKIDESGFFRIVM